MPAPRQHGADDGGGPPGQGSLFAEPTSFVGRERQLGQVEQLLRAYRLVTLTGLGGVGKTRLAKRAAARLQPSLRDGVWFADLTTLRDPQLLTVEAEDPQLLAHLVANALGVVQQPTAPALQSLISYLARRRGLLVLDSCEHLLPGSALLAQALLHGCPRLRILATSREPLGVYGETVLVVPPLSTPDSPRPWGLGGYESVALFTARARQAVPQFRLGTDNQAAVASICRRLDGLPLALELAAAWLRVLDPHELLRRLDDRFALLGPAPYDTPDRQRTLRACVDWSFELCGKQERRLWARLAVFTGDFELDVVEDACADDDLPRAEILNATAGLVDKSILACEDDGEQVRYRMLGTIREYGRRKLVEAGELTPWRLRHRDAYERLVGRANTQWLSPQQGYWLARLGREAPNLRAAMEFGVTDPDEAEGALRIAVALPRLHWSRGLFREGQRWLERALSRAVAPTPLRARALLLASYLAGWQGDVTAGTRLLDEGEALARRLDDRVALAQAAYARGLIMGRHNQLPAAIDMLDRGLAILAETAQPAPELRLDLLLALGAFAGLAGAERRTRTCRDELLGLTQHYGDLLYRSITLWVSGLAAWQRGDLPEATRQVSDSLRLRQGPGLDDRFGVALCLEVLAWVAARQEQYRRAATLLGATDALWTELGTPIRTHADLAGFRGVCEEDTRRALGKAAFDAAVHRGAMLLTDEVLRYALRQPR